MMTAPKSLNVFRYFFPSRAADEARQPGSFWPAAAVYVALLLASAIFYAHKPFDFPERNAAIPEEIQGLSFWLGVMFVWQPPLEIMWIVFLTILIEWMREGRLAAKLISGVAMTAAPFILIVLYVQGALGKAAYALLAVAWFGLLTPMLKRASKEQWRVLIAFMLGLNIIGIATLIPMRLAWWLDKTELYYYATGFYKTSQVVGGLWILGTGTLGLRALTGIRLPRCFMALLLSMFMQIAFALTLHMLDVVPKEVLKALLYA